MEEDEKIDYKLHLHKQLDNLVEMGISVYDLEVVNKQAIRSNYILKDKIKEEIRELEQQIAEFKEYVKDSKGQEKIYWRRELAELVGARNSLRGLLKEE